MPQKTKKRQVIENNNAQTTTVNVKKNSTTKPNIGSNWKNFLSQQQQLTIPKTERKPISKMLKTVDNSTKCVLARPKVQTSKKHRPYRSFTPTGMKLIAMDCEMVGIYDGSSILARISLVNERCESIYDTFVQPREEVVDYRTHVSGVRATDLAHVDAKTFETVQREVAVMLKGNILVGHALHNDLRVLYLSHSRKYIRDTARYKPFRELNGGRTPSLKFLAKAVLKKEIQDGEHDSVVDAKTAMMLYREYREAWETDLKNKRIAKKTPEANVSVAGVASVI